MGRELLWVIPRIHFKYETLPQFCYCCGIFGHGDHDYLLWFDKNDKFLKSGFSDGLWLRANGGPM